MRSPDDLKDRVRTPTLADPTLEDAFIAIVETDERKRPHDLRVQSPRTFDRVRRIAALIRNELRQIMRGLSSLIIAVILPPTLLFLFG